MIDKFILWLDLLGFKQFLLDESRVRQEWPRIEKELNRIITATSNNAKSLGFQLKGTVISDTLIFDISPINGNSLTLLSLIACELQAYFMRCGFLSRGVISLGSVYSPRFKKVSSYVGYPIVEAATLENDLPSPVVILAPSTLNFLLEHAEEFDSSLSSANVTSELPLRSMLYPMEVWLKKSGVSTTFIVIQFEYFIENLKSYLDVAFSKERGTYTKNEFNAIADKLKNLRKIVALILSENSSFKTDIVDRLDFILDRINDLVSS